MHDNYKFINSQCPLREFPYTVVACIALSLVVEIEKQFIIGYYATGYTCSYTTARKRISWAENTIYIGN